VRAEGVARRYAAAFLATVPLPERAGVDARLSDAAALLTAPPVGPLFLHPGVAPDEKVRAAAQVFKDDLPLGHLVGVLINHRRERLLPLVAQEFHRARLEAEGRVSAAVRTARPLDAPARAGVVAGLSRSEGRPVDAEFRVAPELVGGIEVRIQDRLWDGTIRGRLRRLARELKDEVKPGES
jgi:F-type H+-transporting ATPase subunit delta